MRQRIVEDDIPAPHKPWMVVRKGGLAGEGVSTVVYFDDKDIAFSKADELNTNVSDDHKDELGEPYVALPNNPFNRNKYKIPDA